MLNYKGALPPHLLIFSQNLICLDVFLPPLVEEKLQKNRTGFFSESDLQCLGQGSLVTAEHTSVCFSGTALHSIQTLSSEPSEANTELPTIGSRNQFQLVRKQWRPEVPCPHFSQQVLVLEALRIDKVSRLWNSQAQVFKGVLPPGCC